MGACKKAKHFICIFSKFAANLNFSVTKILENSTATNLKSYVGNITSLCGKVYTFSKSERIMKIC